MQELTFSVTCRDFRTNYPFYGLSIPTKDLICMLFKGTYLPCKIKVHFKGFNKSLWTISAFQKVFKTGRISKIILKCIQDHFWNLRSILIFKLNLILAFGFVLVCNFRFQNKNERTNDKSFWHLVSRLNFYAKYTHFIMNPL